MNRFNDIDGDLCTQLAPWSLKKLHRALDVPLFRLEQDICFRSDIAGGTIIVPKGYISDLASIPRPAWAVFMAPDDPRIALGAWVHDLIYGTQGKIFIAKDRIRTDGPTPMYPVQIRRKDADAILAFEAMPDLLASTFQCSAVYQCLRRFGFQWPANSFTERFT